MLEKVEWGGILFILRIFIYSLVLNVGRERNEKLSPFSVFLFLCLCFLNLLVELFLRCVTLIKSLNLSFLIWKISTMMILQPFRLCTCMQRTGGPEMNKEVEDMLCSKSSCFLLVIITNDSYMQHRVPASVENIKIRNSLRNLV